MALLALLQACANSPETSELAIAVAIAGVTAVSHLPSEEVRNEMTSHSALTAFWLGVIGYALLMPAMQNTLLLLTLSARGSTITTTRPSDVCISLGV
jgi:hypothetical protein